MIVFIFLCVSLSRLYKLNHEISSDAANPNQMNYDTLIFGSNKSPKRLVNLTRDCHSESWKNLSLMVLIISGDIQVNPGPSVYPCGFCQHLVTWEHNRAIACDQCSVCRVSIEGVKKLCIDFSNNQKLRYVKYNRFGQCKKLLKHLHKSEIITVKIVKNQLKI